MPRGIPNSRKAKDTPVLATNIVDGPEHVVQEAPRILKSTGDAKDALERRGVQICDERPVDEEKLAMLAFMEEPVTVHIHTTSDKEAEQIFEIFNNGQREVFRRGEDKTVRRKFVNELATRKITSWSWVPFTSPEGIKSMKYVPTTSLRYPFSVTQDPHPRGADWLKATLAMN